MCPEIGIEKKSFSAHHKSHINKVMGHATVAYLFWDTPENGGKGWRIFPPAYDASKVGGNLCETNP